MPCWSCRRVAPRSAPASTRIRSSAPGSPRCWPRKPACRSSRPRNHFEANANRDGLVECSGQLRSDRGHPVLDRQQHPLARLRPALRLLRGDPARPPARLVDHARQGQPGHVRGDDAGLRPRHRQRSVPGLFRGDGRPVRAEHHDAGHGPGHSRKHPLLASCTQAFVDFCALEMEANRAACEKQVEWSMAMVTSLNPLIGYDAAAALPNETSLGFTKWMRIDESPSLSSLRVAQDQADASGGTALGRTLP